MGLGQPDCERRYDSDGSNPWHSVQRGGEHACGTSQSASRRRRCTFCRRKATGTNSSRACSRGDSLDSNRRSAASRCKCLSTSCCSAFSSSKPLNSSRCSASRRGESLCTCCCRTFCRGKSLGTCRCCTLCRRKGLSTCRGYTLRRRNLRKLCLCSLASGHECEHVGYRRLEAHGVHRRGHKPERHCQRTDRRHCHLNRLWHAVEHVGHDRYGTCGSFHHRYESVAKRCRKVLQIVLQYRELAREALGLVLRLVGGVASLAPRVAYAVPCVLRHGEGVVDGIHRGCKTEKRSLLTD